MNANHLVTRTQFVRCALFAAAGGLGTTFGCGPSNRKLRITTTSLPVARVGQPYLGTVNVKGAKGPITWALSNGTLPSGLSLSSETGQITGTPTTAGTSSFTVTVTEPGRVASQKLTLQVT